MLALGPEKPDDHLHMTRGPHGHGSVNDAGKELLGFLITHQATACNTWFQKKDIHLAIWQHPKSKSWFCIDYIVMRQKDRKLCVDAAVKRGAECNTEHQFLCAELRMAWKCCKPKPQKEVRRFDASGLRRVSRTGGGEVRSQRQEYVEGVVERAREEWPDEGTVEEKWRAMRTALVDTAGETLGKAKRSQPDWFLDADDTIRPFLQTRNAAYTKWLATGDRQELVKFREARGRARLEVRKAKDDWFRKKAQDCSGKAAEVG